MKTKSNELQELTNSELREINGGWFWVVLGGAAVVEVLSDWDNFKAGLMGEPPVK